MVTVNMELPDEMIAYAMPEDKERQLIRNAMMLYPYILEKRISHGRAAEMLGLHKIDLITLYGKLGLPYFDETEEELEEDLAVLKNLRGATV